MAEPIPTPPCAASARTASVLQTSLLPNLDAPPLSADAIDPTKLFGNHYDYHGGNISNIVSLTPEFINNDTTESDNSSKRPLPLDCSPTMASSPRKQQAVSVNCPSPRRVALAGLMVLGAVVDQNIAGLHANAFLPPLPCVARPLPFSVLDHALDPAAPTNKKTKWKGSRTGGYHAWAHTRK